VTGVFAGLLAEAFTGVCFAFFGAMMLKVKRVKGTAKAREIMNDDGRRKKEKFQGSDALYLSARTASRHHVKPKQPGKEGTALPSHLIATFIHYYHSRKEQGNFYNAMKFYYVIIFIKRSYQEITSNKTHGCQPKPNCFRSSNWLSGGGCRG
jgi:hypothetical protein